MKYITILGIIAALISVFFYQQIFSESTVRHTPKTEVENTDRVDNLSLTVVDNKTGESTLEKIRSWDEDLECVITTLHKNDSEQVEGTYFVSNKNVRGDFLTSSPDLDGQLLSSLIIKNDEMYVWSEIEGELYGVKMDLTLVKDGELAAGQVISLDDEVEYSCELWSRVDQTVFDPPSSVLFKDLNDLLNSGMEYGTVYEEE